jgi:hypothetical protein
VCRRSFSRIALTPAKTLEGVLAKLAACADTLAEVGSFDPEEDGIEWFIAERVAIYAAFDYAALLKAQEV